MRPLLMQPWSDADLKVLSAMLTQREPIRHIAWKLRRTESAVRSKLVKLGLRIPPGTKTMQDMRRAAFGKGSLPENA